MLYQDSVSKGQMSPEALVLYAYGIYIMNGGDPDDFDKFSRDDMEILITTFLANRKYVLDVFYKMFKGLSGAKD